MTRRAPAFWALLVALGLAATAAAAQFGQRGGRGFFNTRLATEADVDGGFHFCRVVFASDPRGGADRNLPARMSMRARIR